MRSRRRRGLRAAGAAALCGLETGCAPSTNVLGAYFPDWLICMVAGVVLTVVVYAALARLDERYRPVAPALTWPALATLLTLAVWLVFFRQ
ncbi:YtcA family lipoprotein [Paraburkholderia sp. J76]|uniref:YtcA family lipoprotein n=1 Tax=Paraburkholderia sp. J76 TaxID=2805439 RepID=UPI002ABE030E|nr:YtcA family lipoprotein [Paraburkholderia sp. J76]